MYLEGSSILEITRALETDKIKTVTGKDTWHPGVIEKMLSNEKYMGDALLQKTYTVDFLTKKRVKMRELYLNTISKITMRQLYQRKYFIKYKKRKLDGQI